MRRSGNRCPILILSLLVDVDERICGLRAGGDDYLTRPFSFGELEARLEALVRRGQQPVDDAVLTVGDLRLERLSRKVTRAGTPIAMHIRRTVAHLAASGPVLAAAAAGGRLAILGAEYRLASGRVEWVS